MQITNLKNTPLEKIVASLVTAFEGYFVQMPDDVEYWRNRFRGARVDFELSYGVFDKEELVAFIINGVDELNDDLTAFNTGTGVIPVYRGQQLVDKMYSYALPVFKKRGISKCALEVIQANARAIKVYERIGFSIERQLKCFKGTIAMDSVPVHIKKTNFNQLLENGSPGHNYYSWDHTNPAIVKSGDLYETYTVLDTNKKSIGYFNIQANGYVAQLEAKSHHFPLLVSGIQQITDQIRINNVDDRRTDLVDNLLACGLLNTIDQYEMGWKI